MKGKGTAESKSAIRDGRKRLHFVDCGRAGHRREPWKLFAIEGGVIGIGIANRTSEQCAAN